MSKISGYANSVSALGTDDLIDVSEKISSSPDVYESRKMTGATLATFISSYAANIISTDGLTMTANRTHDLGSYVLTFQNAGLAIEGAQTIKAASAVADMFNLYDSTGGLLSRFNSTYISLWATSQIASEVFGVTGHTILKGIGTAGTNKVLDLYDSDTTPASIWSFRSNGDIYQGKDSDWFLNSKLLTFNATNLGGFDDPYIQLMLNGGIEITSSDTDGALKVLDARTTSSETVFQVGRAINTNGTWNQQDIRIGKIVDNDYIKMANSAVEIVDGGTTRHKFTGVNAYLGGSSAIGLENILLKGDILAGTTGDSIGFMGTTPIVQVTTGVAAATFTANTSGIADDTATFDGYTIGQVVKALRNYGLLA